MSYCRWMLAGMLALLVCGAARGHTPYAKAMKARYELRSVSCYACHVKGKDEATGKPLGKEHLNKFGIALHAVLKDKGITAKLAAAKELEREQRDKVNEAAAAEFLSALKQIENKPNDDDKSWRQLIESGQLEGIKLAE